MSDSTGDSARTPASRGVGGRLRPVIGGLLLGVAGLLAGALLGALGVLGLALLGVPVFEDATLLMGAGVLFQGAGFVAATVGYLRYRRAGVEYLRLRRPTVSDAVWAVGGLFLLFVLLAAVNTVVTGLGIGSPAEHEIVRIGIDQPAVLLVLVPLSVLVIGPTEELLFRGAIQTSLVDAYGPVGGIVATSAVFAVVHLPVYATASADAVATSIAVVFTLSVVLGWIYERADNLLVPAAVHGTYNAVLFGALYVVVTTDVAL